jgi:hypothetical protein
MTIIGKGNKVRVIDLAPFCGYELLRMPKPHFCSGLTTARHTRTANSRPLWGLLISVEKISELKSRGETTVAMLPSLAAKAWALSIRSNLEVSR